MGCVYLKQRLLTLSSSSDSVTYAKSTIDSVSYAIARATNSVTNSVCVNKIKNRPGTRKVGFLGNRVLFVLLVYYIHYFKME